MSNTIDFTYSKHNKTDGSGGFAKQTGHTYKDRAVSMSPNIKARKMIQVPFLEPKLLIQRKLDTINEGMSLTENLRDVFRYHAFQESLPLDYSLKGFDSFLSAALHKRRLDYGSRAVLYQEMVEGYLKHAGYREPEVEAAPAKDKLLFRTIVSSGEVHFRGPALFEKADGGYGMSFCSVVNGRPAEITMTINGQQYCTYGKNQNCTLKIIKED